MNKRYFWLIFILTTAVSTFLFALQLAAKTAVVTTNGGASVDIVSWEREEDTFWFTVRLQNGLPHTQYELVTKHVTDQPYSQFTTTIKTDAAGHSSSRMWSGCTYNGMLTDHVVATVEQGGNVLTTTSLSCPDIRYINNAGAYLASDNTNSRWTYRSDEDAVTIWIEDSALQTGLSGSVRILSAQGYDSGLLGLADNGNGRYAYTWTIPNNPDPKYRVQFTLDDNQGGHSGLDGHIHFAGNHLWIWGALEGNANPQIWAILTNDDYDNDGIGDRDQLFAFMDAPHGAPAHYARTGYLSVYPYISHTDFSAKAEFQAFLQAAHNQGLYIEALAGTHLWVENDALLQEGKNTCDNILAFNADADDGQRFDGIHLDVEHDVWDENGRWARLLDLLSYCRDAIDTYSQTYDTITLSADIPPHFLTGEQNSGNVMSNWDVMQYVDSIALMDYRDFAYERWDGREDGIVPRAEPFMADGNALGTAVIIGLELTPNTYNHVTFFEECLNVMTAELDKVSQAYAFDSTYAGLAFHAYNAWSGKTCSYLPMLTRAFQ